MFYFDQSNLNNVSKGNVIHVYKIIAQKEKNIDQILF